MCDLFERVGNSTDDTLKPTRGICGEVNKNIVNASLQW